MTIAETTEREAEPARDLEQLVRLVEDHRVEEARRLAPEAGARGGEGDAGH